MKRLIALLSAMAAVPLVAAAPPAEAIAAGTCTITGTISFTPGTAAASTTGAWNIGPAAITCQGLNRGPERYLGQGPFSGSGSYAVLPSGAGACVHQIGQGTVEYTVPTSGTDLHVKEAHQFILAGAGKFTTPSLRGSFVVAPPFEGDCITTPVTRATFAAQAVLARELPVFLNQDGQR